MDAYRNHQTKIKRLKKSFILALMIFLCINAAVVAFVYLQYKRNVMINLQETALSTVTILDRLFTVVSLTNENILNTVNNSCDTLLSTIHNAEFQTPFISYIAIYNKSMLHCDELQKNRPFIPLHIKLHNEINLVSDMDGLSHLVLFKSSNKNYSVVSFVNATYIKMILNMSGGNDEIYFSVAEKTLSKDGRIKNEIPHDKPMGLSFLSNKYGFSIQISTSKEIKVDYDFFNNNFFLLFCGTILSLLIGGAAGVHFNRPPSMISEIMSGIINEEFIPYYQPIINSQTGAVEGAEILMRWRHPDKGMLYPSEFISHAESAGLIIKMTEQIMTKSNAHLLSSIKSLPSKFKININVTPMHMKDESFASLCYSFLDVFEKWELGVEVTESMLLESNDELQATLKNLLSERLTLSLDDFGTGYSSLKLLQAVPFKTIKIDKSFVSGIGVDIKSETIIKNIINLAQSMNMEIVAEGVENEEQADYLISMGVSFLQGYLYGKPMDLASLLNYLPPKVPNQCNSL